MKFSRSPSGVAWTLVLLVVVVLAPARLALAGTDEFDVIRTRWVDYLTAVDRPASDPATAAAIDKLNDAADKSAREQSPEGSWPPEADEEPVNNNSIWRTITIRLRPLAQAWATPQAKRFHDVDTAAAFARALTAYLPTIEQGARERPGNWWIWDIGTPMDLGNCLLLAGDSLPPELRMRAAAALTSLLRLSGDDPQPGGVLGIKFRGKNSPGFFTGQNAVWIDMARMRLGLLIRDADTVRIAAQDIAKVCVRLPRADKYFEGVTPDGSYLIHGPQIMWSYGAGQVQDTALATMLLSGTPLAMPREAVVFQEDLLLDSAAWCTTKYLFHPMIVGRGYAHGGAPKANGLLAGAMMLALADGPRHGECAALAKRWLEDSDTAGGIPDSQLGLSARVRALPGPAAAPMDGCRAFPDGDYLAIQRPEWGAGLKMYSERTWPSEITNGEGLQSLHNSDGTLFLIQKTTDWPIEVLAAYNWNHLPGATICPSQVVDKWQKTGTTAFVGALASGRRAVAAQDLKTGELRAHKSWLVFDDTIICLGSGIVGPEGTETTIAQTPITKPDEFTCDGVRVEGDGIRSDGAAVNGLNARHVRKVMAGGVGYVLLEFGGPLTVGRVTRAGSKHALVASASDKPLSPVTFAELYLAHGAPTAASPGKYAYVVLPGVDPVASPAWAKEIPRFEVLAHTDEIHAVYDRDNNCGAAVFWKAGAVVNLSVDAPCIALWKHGDKGEWIVSVADPTHATRTIKVGWKERGEKTVEVRDGRPGEVIFQTVP